MQIKDIQALSSSIKANVEKVIIGKSDIIDLILTSVIAGGHVLLEDVPGTGKTVLAKSLAKSLGVDFKRIQFTPDLLPSDLTGINYYNQKLGEFTFRQGPIFTNILLADEINRATPRTQSSLLESMEEKQITIDGETRILERPFFVIATQNPVETQGTFPLPEAQLDRFFIQINMGYPSIEEGKAILKRFILNNPLEEIASVCSKEDLLEAGKVCKNVFVHESIQQYILEIIEQTRNNEAITLGVSPRGSLAMLKAAQVYAAIQGRNFVTPDDIKALTIPVFGHRIILRGGMHSRSASTHTVLNTILEKVLVPTENWTAEVK
jgi:MoxR-like ATPase